jgi:DDE superfamily endonuclease
MLVGPYFYDKYVRSMPDETPLEIASNPKLYPYFKYCRGALDGSYFNAWVREEAMARHRTRKGLISKNVLAACDFDMKFTYILPGWEGSAADSTIFEYAREHDLAVPVGRYLLADAGFPLCDALMTPYRGVCYHLKEWARGNQRYFFKID